MPVDAANQAVTINLFYKLFYPLRELLESILTGVEAGEYHSPATKKERKEQNVLRPHRLVGHLLLESGNLSMTTGVRPIFIARM